MKRTGFTLIELLVVIAIIAILAAILFPVFAKVREKARQTSCTSNMKQIGLAIVQYQQDYDEVYPTGLQDSWWANTWVLNVQPYVKSIAVFHCPDDSSTTLAAPINWAGVGLSYASNGWVKGVPGGNTQEGVIGIAQTWVSPMTRSLASVNRPSDTIMVAEKHNGDVIAHGYNGVPSVWGPGCMFTQISSWDGLGAPQELPDGSKSLTAAYPNGANGAVTAAHTGRANFLFCDGHVKSMFPYATNPNPTTKPDENLWDAARQ